MVVRAGSVVALEYRRGVYIRMRIEVRTMKETIGSRAVERTSCWDWKGSLGSGSLWMARVDIKTAPTPIYDKPETTISIRL